MRRIFLTTACVSTLALLSACGTPMPAGQGPAPAAPAPPAPTGAPPPPGAAVTPAAPAATPGLAARERLQLAVNLLSQGNPTQAALELRAYLADVPNSGQARMLLSHIETPIEQLFPADNFTLTLGMGETLGTFAQQFLGDVNAFYALARYNGIAVPDRVREGQTIKIPRTPQTLAALNARNAQLATATPPPAAAAPPTVASNTPPRPGPAAPRNPWAVIRDETSAGRFDAAIREAETSRVTPDKAQAALLASAYIGNARAIRGSNATLAGAQALRAGDLYLNTADRPEDAIAPLQLAVELSPADTRAQTMLASAKTKTADAYYRTGLEAFQRQDLDRAIAAWDRALALNPNHKNAQLQKAQALELKANLQKLR